MAHSLHWQDGMRTHTSTTLQSFALHALTALALLALVACGGSADSDGGDKAAGEGATSETNHPQVVPSMGANGMANHQASASTGATGGGAQGAAAMADNASAFPTAADPATSTGKLSERLVAFLQRWAKREAAFVESYKASFNKELGKVRWFKRLSTAAYESRGYALAFSDGTKLIAGVPMLLALKELESHGLDAKDYQRDVVEGLVKSVETAGTKYQGILGDTGTAKESALWKVLDKLRGRASISSVQLDKMLSAQKLSDADLGAMSRLESRMGSMFEAKAGLNTAFIRLDLALTQSYFRYAFDMRYRKVAHPFEADKSYGRGLERAADALLERYKKAKFDANFGNELTALVPAIPEYQVMRTQLAFYEGLAAANSHIRLPNLSARLRPGSKGKFVLQLMNRLKQEGYYNGEIHPVYDEAVAEAVTLYQVTHQLKQADGKMTSSTRRSMNVPYSDRAKALSLGLQRHRESELHQNPAFAFGKADIQARINIPAFEATFYKAGKPVRVQNIVVGANTLGVHESTGLRGHFNRTRMFSRRLKTIVLNPVWRVPPRIKHEELDRALVNQPDFYAKNNYKVKILADGTEQVTQLPGPKNALGLVKFLFPNQFSIYMHDTPKKRLFKRTIRAFSHGCMRVENAMDLARYLLIEVEGMNARKFERVLAKRKTYGVKVKKDIAITIDYSSVGIHAESGKAMFYSDIYDYDEDFAAGKTPYKKYPQRGLEQAVVLSKKKR